MRRDGLNNRGVHPQVPGTRYGALRDATLREGHNEDAQGIQGGSRVTSILDDFSGLE
jgi:hypothetical protein